MPISIKQLSLGLIGLFLLLPAGASAAVNTDAYSAATDGIRYLANNQAADGSITGFGGASEWSVEAVLAAGQTPGTFAHNGSSDLLNFVKNDSTGATVTALERNMIALAEAGQSVTNYEDLLAAQNNNSQIGDTTLLNDDMFGIIAIDAAHDTELLPEAQDALNYLIANQGVDGTDTGFGYSNDCTSWCYSDSGDTASAIIAFKAAEDLGLSNEGLANAETNALNYLLSTQQADGGFAGDNSGFSPSDGDSTAWGLMALNMIGSSVSTQAAQARTWLINTQNSDGGFTFGAYGTTASDTYTTAHAVIALLGTTWLLRPTPISAPAATPTTPTSTPTTTTVTTTSTPAPKPATNPQTTDTTDTTPQVKGAETVKQLLTTPTTDTTEPTASHHGKGIVGYIVALLAVVAILWFVLESRKDKGANDAK